MTANDQIIDAKVSKILAHVQMLRTKAEEKLEEAKKMGNYKTNCTFPASVSTGTRKLQTVGIEELIGIATTVLEHKKNHAEALKVLGIDLTNSHVKQLTDVATKISGFSHEEWLNDIKICLLKKEGQIFENQAREVEKKALGIESESNKRNRAADSILGELGID